MRIHHYPRYFIYLSVTIFVFTASLHSVRAQVTAGQPSVSSLKLGSFAGSVFIENVGQYGDSFKDQGSFGRILYAFDGMDMPVLISRKGLIHLHRKVAGISHEEEEAMEKAGVPEEEIERKKVVIDKFFTMEWVGINQESRILATKETQGYHTFGYIGGKAKGYREILFEDAYPGIDIRYSIDTEKEGGFEYALIVHPGADLSVVRCRFGGDLKKIKKSSSGDLVLETAINSTRETRPIAFHPADKLQSASPHFTSSFIVDDQDVRFSWPEAADRGRMLIIDPFVSNTNNLTGGNAGIAKDVDFDYAGNVYVTGGGDGSVHKLSKFDPNGILLWTFSGSMTVPAWSFGTYYGGWVVEKNTGKTYLGQGFSPGTGFIVIRLNADGIYDNYITTGNTSFQENWKMLWSCNGGSPQILVAGGGTNSNINMGRFAPPGVSVTATNLTGIANTGATGWAQDVADIVLDPVNGDVYTIYGSLIGTPSISNMIYKNAAPYSAASLAWSVNSGFVSIMEIQNRPYLTAGLIDNSCNVLAVNANYLFYWDGRNLKAFNKATGAAVGTSLTIAANTLLQQGGIVADECNNIFIGSSNGTIKVYKFTGTVFDDAAAADISIPGFATSGVYDLVYNEAQKLLYASGGGFVSSIDVSAYSCGSAVYNLSVNGDCANLTAVATLSPAPPVSSTVTYILYNNLVQVSTNNTGVFTNLTPGTTYSLHAIINQTCSGVRTIANFSLPSPQLSLTHTDASCGNASGSIAAVALGGVNPLQYSIDGTNFQISPVFNGLVAGVYVVHVKDAAGCMNADSVTIVNSNGPQIALAGLDATCGGSNGSIEVSVTGGTPPYQYSLNGGAYQVSNIFGGLNAGNYLITVRDATNCTNQSGIQVFSIGTTQASTVITPAICGNQVGSITINVTGGTAPYQYSLNGGAFQVFNSFSGLAAGNYTIQIRDANGCLSSVSQSVANIAGPQISATAAPTSCVASTGTITAVGSGGTLPYNYSINNGLSFQAGNVFTNLLQGSYIVIVRDANGCTNSTTVTISITVPQVTGTTTPATCNVNDGTITAVGTGGSAPYQFSINGTVFQSAALFSGLAAGSYTLTIRDANSCVNSFSPIIIGNSSGLTVTASSTLSSCTANTGIITALANGGIPSLTYSINGTTFQSSNIFTGLAAGNYTVTAMDQSGCRSITSIQVSTVPGPSVSATNTSTSCNNPNGTITVTGSLGAIPYTYSINGTLYQVSNVFTGLTPGLYTVYVKDANGCVGTVNTSIANTGGGSGPTVTADVTAAECGQSNGRIDARATGGQNPTRYSLDGINYQNSSTFNNIPPGTYTVYVRDRNGCVNFITVVVPNIAGPQVSAVTTPSDCGGSTGTITAAGFDGTAPYRYSIDGGANFQTSSFFSGLTAGFYTVTVRDNDNVCRNSIVVYVANSSGADITANTEVATCGQNNGVINIAVSGGLAPFTYSINGVDFQTSNVFTGMTPGTYAITVIDVNGCGNSVSVTVGDAPLPQVSALTFPEACSSSNGRIHGSALNGTAPFEYSLDGLTYQSTSIFTGLQAGSYTISLKDANGCISATNVSVASVGGPSLSANVGASLCSSATGSIIITGNGGTLPYQYSVNGILYQPSFVFTNLTGGVYNVRIKDANNCISSIPVTVSAIGAPGLTATITPASCGIANGTITATGSGGSGSLQYSINGTDYQVSGLFSGLAEGTYTVYVRDGSGCMFSIPVDITASPLPALSVSTTMASCGQSNGSITASVQSGSSPYTYSLDGSAFQNSGNFSNLSAGTFLVTVKDSLGCMVDTLVTISSTGSMNGIYLVGTGGDFTTLTAAVQAYNTQCISGPIEFHLTDALYSTGETFPIQINSNIYASSVNTLTIRPSVGHVVSIIGHDPVAVIQLRGADHILIEGSNAPGGNTSDLTIQNDHASATENAVIWIQGLSALDGATYNSIQHCVIRGKSSVTTGAGIMLSGLSWNTPAEGANHHILIKHNTIESAQKAICLIGAGQDSLNVIEYNVIGSSVPENQLGVAGVMLESQTKAQINNNIIQGVINAQNQTVSGIYVSGGSTGISIYNNDISSIRNSQPAANGAHGIYLASSETNAGIQVYNNFISGVSAYGSTVSRDASNNGYGLIIDGGGGYTIWFNSIVMDQSQTIQGFPSAVNISSGVTAASSIDLRNNLLGNLQTQPGDHLVLQSSAPASVFNFIDYNNYFNASGALGYINGNRVSLADLRSGFGNNSHSLNVIPVFAAAGNWHIDPTVIGNALNLGDRGIPVSIPVDIDGASRNGLAPDIGADEWVKPNYASWVGRVSEDWLVPENWDSNIVPDSSTDVFISGGYTFMPTIITTQPVRDLNMSAPGNPPILTIDQGSLQVFGAINHSGGTIKAVSGTLEMHGDAPQLIPAGLFDQNSLNNLIISNTTPEGVTLAGALDIYRSVTFTTGGKTLNTGNNLTFKSTDTLTAWLGNLTGKTFSGEATVERRIPNHSKAWQFLAVPTTGQTVKEAWQEGSTLANGNPHPGFGTQITNNVPNAVVHPIPGFDLASTNGPSIKQYNSVTGLFEGIPSTGEPIASPKGYMLFVRGDRSATAFNSPTSATTLRSKGILYTPDHPPAVTTILSGTPTRTIESVANPYASAIDLTKLVLNETGGGVQDIFYVWDPRLTTNGVSAYGLGAYQVLTRNGASYDVTPGGGSYGATEQLIQSGQAFFASAPITGGTLQFNENCKVIGSQSTFRQGNTHAYPSLRSNLYVMRNGEPVLLDGNLLQIDDGFVDGFDQLDAVKFQNQGENWGIDIQSRILSVSKRNQLHLNDTVWYRMSQIRQQEYRLAFVPSILQDPSLTAFLEDLHTQTSTPISLSDTTWIQFAVTADTGSYRSNRFRIVFQQLTTTPVQITDINARYQRNQDILISWKVENEEQVFLYVVEHSLDGSRFTDLITQAPARNNGSGYFYTGLHHDPSPVTHYYRIRIMHQDGRVRYSDIVRLSPNTAIHDISVYPNPVHDQQVFIRLNNMPSGEYIIRLYNQSGQLVYYRQSSVNGNSVSKSIRFEPPLPSGMYQLELANQSEAVLHQSIIIQ